MRAKYPKGTVNIAVSHHRIRRNRLRFILDDNDDKLPDDVYIGCFGFDSQGLAVEVISFLMYQWGR